MSDSSSHHCQAIAIGGSAGARKVLLHVLKALPRDFRLPIILCHHLPPSDKGYFPRRLNRETIMDVTEASDKMSLQPGRVYVAPADYHLLVERDETLALSVDEKVCWSRPSVDVLFDSAAHVYTTGLLAILLSGASEDGTAGLRAIQHCGGVTVAQKPSTAEYPFMPQSAINCGVARLILTPEEIRQLIVRLHGDPRLDAILPGH